MQKAFLIIYFSTFLGVFIHQNLYAQWNMQKDYSSALNVIWPCAVNENVVWGIITYSNPPTIWGYFKTTDGGNNWTDDTVTVGTQGTTCIHARNANTAYLGVILNSGEWKIIKTTDGGTTWFPQNTATYNYTSYINMIHFFDNNNGITIGDQIGGYLEIYTTTNGEL